MTEDAARPLLGYYKCQYLNMDHFVLQGIRHMVASATPLEFLWMFTYTVAGEEDKVIFGGQCVEEAVSRFCAHYKAIKAEDDV